MYVCMIIYTYTHAHIIYLSLSYKMHMFLGQGFSKANQLIQHSIIYSCIYI